MKICGTSEADFNVPGENWSPEYLSSEDLGRTCQEPKPCFLRDGTVYDCDNPPSSSSSGGGGGGGGGDVPTVRIFS